MGVSFEFLSSQIVLGALQALSSSTKQILRVTVTSTGVHFRCEDDGKVCQSSVQFPASYFTSFDATGAPTTFNVQLVALADALRVFASLPDVPVSITETAQHLVLETSDIDEGVSMNMHAHINILGEVRIDNLLDHWKLPVTEFTTYENVLREAIEDLEWPHGHMKLSVQAHPFQVVLSSRGNIGELDVVLPNNHIRNPRTHGTSISHFYAYKFSKSAFTGILGTKGTYSSHVSIDSNGLLKVVHLLPGMQQSAAVASQASQATTDITLSYVLQPMFHDELNGEDQMLEFS
eukprot:jgi/Ulvmu1/399/UM001_0406.1